MAGIIREAEKIHKAIAKAKSEIACKNEYVSLLPSDPRVKAITDATEQSIIAAQMKHYREVFQIAVQLREVAIETGLLKKPSNNTPLLEASPSLVGRYCMISIRPIPGSCFNTFKSNMFRYIERGIFVGGELTFEQIGESQDELGEGFHVHIVAEVKNYVQVKEIIRDAEKDIRMQHQIQIGRERAKFMKTERDLEYARNYIRGRKHNDEKEAAISWNPAWRIRECLNDLYVFGEWSAPAMSDTYDDDDPESSPKDGVIIEEIS